MNAQELATLLLVMRLIAVVLLVAVVIKQVSNLRNLHTDYPAVRWGVFAATIILLVGQFIPILLDTVVAFGETYAGRNTSPNLLGSSYALNNAGKDVVIGALLLLMHYRPSRTRKKH